MLNKLDIESISNAEFLKELYRRMKSKEIIIRGRKWKSNYSGIPRKQTIIISDKSNPKNYIASYKAEGQVLWLDGKRSF